MNEIVGKILKEKFFHLLEKGDEEEFSQYFNEFYTIKLLKEKVESKYSHKFMLKIDY